MPEQNTIQPNEVPSYEQFWAWFQESTKRFAVEMQESKERFDHEMKERDEKFAREMQERDEKFAREMQERDEKLERERQESKEEFDRSNRAADRRMKKLEKNLGGLGDSIGKLIETLIAASLWEKFSAYPYNLQRAYRRIPIYNEENKAITDVDILLSDTEWVMAVEVKRVPDKDEIDRHVVRMDRIRKYPPAEVKGKKLLGAIAGGVVDPDVQVYAYEAGFFILELKGESVALVPPPPGFSPKTW